MVRQNNKENLNSTIWERVPKSNFVSLPILEFGAYDAVAWDEAKCPCI